MNPEDLEAFKGQKMAPANLEECKALDERTFSVPASTESVDGHGEIIEVKGWDLTRYTGKKGGGVPNKKGNPVILYGHNTFLPIGKALEAVKDTAAKALRITYRLMSEEEYGGEWPAVAPSPKSIAAMLVSKMIKGHSVGFRPIRSEPMEAENEGLYWKPQRYLEQQLNELSVVTIPSNNDCLENALQKGYLERSHLPGIVQGMSVWGGEDEIARRMIKVMGEPRQFTMGGTVDPVEPEAAYDPKALMGLLVLRTMDRISEADAARLKGEAVALRDEMTKAIQEERPAVIILSDGFEVEYFSGDGETSAGVILEAHGQPGDGEKANEEHAAPAPGDEPAGPNEARALRDVLAQLSTNTNQED